MLSTLHGHLALTIDPIKEIPLSMGGRAEICTIRGEAFGCSLNVNVTLDVNTGELLLFSPDAIVGSFRLGDLIAAQVAAQIAKAQRAREEGQYAQAH